MQHAPPGWAQHYAPDSGTLAGLLFLDGMEAGAGGTLLVFDFGNLDQLATGATAGDRGRGVSPGLTRAAAPAHIRQSVPVSLNHRRPERRVWARTQPWD